MSSAAAMPLPDATARRRYARFQIAVPFDLTVFRPGSVVRLSGSTQDIGDGGLCGMISGAALLGERVELTLVLPTSAEPLSMRAVVRHQDELNCGFEFLSLEHDQRERLQQLGTDPGLQASLINETEWEPGLAPPPRSEAAVCPVCGHELSEEIPVCLTCGTPHSPEVTEASGEAAAAPELQPAAVPHPPAPKQDAAKARRGPALDSVVAIVFLVTLSIGLWQWMHSPVDAQSDSRPSPVTVELENVFLRPVPGSVDQATAIARARSSAVLSAASSVVTAVIGKASPQEQQPAVGAPGSAAADASRPRARKSVSNSSSNSSPASSASAIGSPTLPSPALSAPASSSSATNSLAASSGAAENGGAAESSSATESSVAGAPSRQAPNGSALAAMLLQKVLPVYPEEAR
ncbi:MAG TPA: PilZ domain-containing protein, partial [Terriglobales bacterium]|nr:PilZ domain-containing protein [Terriglobales bacterium]